MLLVYKQMKCMCCDSVLKEEEVKYDQSVMI